MAAKSSHNGFLSTSSANPWLPPKPNRTHYSCKKASELDQLLSFWGNSNKRCFIRFVLSENSNRTINFRPVGCRKQYLAFKRSRRIGSFASLASADDGVVVNGTPQASTSSDVEEMRVKLSRSLNTDGDGLVQFLHESARVFELAIKEQSPFSKLAWFSTAWLGVDRNAWVKTLSYQASIYSLLQAASKIASRGDSRDKDVNVFVQRSLLRQSACLESAIRDKLSARQSAYEWLWSEQVPKAIESFVNYLEADPRFTAATSVSRQGMSTSTIKSTDVSLLILALTCNAAITKLGSAKVSCPQFLATIPEISGRLMDMLVDFVPIRQAYRSVKDIGLAREFLVHFGPRAAACRIKNDRDSEEVVFWVNLIQKRLQRAIDREKIWSRLTTSESIEVLERDLAIFGFFIALGRRTQSYLSENGYDVAGHPLEGFLRFLIGGSVLYYPQLSSISSYQLYVEVVCEELEWLPFYPGNAGRTNDTHGHRSKPENPPDTQTVLQVLDVCSHWMQSFIKHSKWLENSSNVKAANFLSRGHNKLMGCIEDLGILKDKKMENSAGRIEAGTHSPSEKQSDSFDKALESVEEALTRLENLLQYLHVSSSNSGKENLKAACSDLEKIRTLKKEAEFLEASFRAKADSLQQGVEPMGNDQQVQKRKGGSAQMDKRDRVGTKYPGLRSLFKLPPIRKSNPELMLDESESEFVEQTGSSSAETESNEIRRFELLRSELMELEKRFQRGADQSENEEDIELADDNPRYGEGVGATQLVQAQKKENFIEKSFDKLKETSTDVWQGTQLLAIDVAASSGLVRRALIGDELTEKEKQALRRTLTDLASVVPIGVLMLLPVTAVGHAAILAGIQRYVPALIPSTYGPERLDLLRQLEKVKELESTEESSEANMEELARS